MRIVHAIDCRTTPWKNGGGATTEIAVEPPGASFDDFDWRISMARVASDGPFSKFAGIDRTLAVITGHGLALTIGDATALVLDGDSDPIRFAGDVPTSARLLGGEIVDLNVMTRRGRFEHRLRRIREPVACDFADHRTAVVVAPSGDVSLTSPQGTALLARGDAAILSRADDTPCRIAPANEATECYLVLLRESRQAGRT
ncbi:HutD family protein [Bradyrhizobium lablabi]|uniref:HutD/Ves family protein n=1 Tax=Bradyrhizobium lablabi TaxID=722472 RepID=UPI001BA73479|nr:HutD family protein [Bradyrhizobium lablabi]MBR0697712.1 HutD family protein [Bradyrhizobium lablabi]